MNKLIIGVLLIAMSVLAITAYAVEYSETVSKTAHQVINERSYYLRHDVRTVNYNRNIGSMLMDLNDRHAHFFEPSQLEEFMNSTQPSFVGVGIMVKKVEKGIQVQGVYKQGPADGNLKRNDIIMAVDGISVTDLPLNEGIDLIKGELGTEVKLKILRNNEEKEVALIRDLVQRDMVYATKLTDDIVYLRIDQFIRNVGRAVLSDLSEVITENTDGLVIDLRNNPGGFVNESNMIIDMFLPPEKKIIEIRAYDGTHETMSRLPIWSKVHGLDVVILLNEYSASASELVSSVLRDYKVAKIVGVKSFGKGSVQNIFNLTDGYALKLTIGKYFPPSNYLIDGVGLVPDEEIPLEPADYKILNNFVEVEYDAHIEKAIELIQEGDWNEEWANQPTLD